MRPHDLDATQEQTEGPMIPSGPVFASPLIGEILGDFRIESLLGRGGMGEVYLARQLSLDRPVAFKVLRPESVTSPTSLGRFEAEAGAAARINHPSIVHIYQYGEASGRRYIAMEYVAGTNLREYVRRKGPLDVAVALQIMKQAAQAVGAAGEVGLVHRDIKPDNLLLTRKGQVKVADFGLCRFLGEEALNLTQQGATLGTPLYMSPEQVQSRPVDHRSDLYSLGVTFYYMLTGRPPFQAETALGVAMKHVHEAPPSLAERRPDLPPTLVALVHKLMAKDPDRRYQSAAELIREIAAIRSATAGSAPTLAMGILSTEASPGNIEAPSPGSRIAGPSLRTSPATVAALLLAGLAFGATLGWRGRAADLLADGAPAATSPPALWLAPDWRSVPEARTAEEQYRHAQLKADAAGQAAAWLAVPGRFPEARGWTIPAYVQLARVFFRSGDRERLLDLSRSLEGSGHRSEQDLARVALSATIDDDAKFLDVFEVKGTDTAVLEFALEVVSRRRVDEDDSNIARQIRRHRNSLQTALQLDISEAPGLFRPR